MMTGEKKAKTNFVQIHGNTGLQAMSEGMDSFQSAPENGSYLPPIEDRIATADRSKLEKMSRDIITGLLIFSVHIQLY